MAQIPSRGNFKRVPVNHGPIASCTHPLERQVCGLMDKFEEIFRMQAVLNRRIGVELPPASEEEKAKWILNYTRALQQELAELVDSVPWKWWAKYQKFDEQNARVEVVDLFHFLISLAQTLGMSAEDVFQAYVKKNQVNLQRQDSGYVKKDEADSRHI
jgi:dimeric dUTPase (all-alpha-NTP-PPase superfamily)